MSLPNTLPVYQIGFVDKDKKTRVIGNATDVECRLRIDRTPGKPYAWIEVQFKNVGSTDSDQASENILSHVIIIDLLPPRIKSFTSKELMDDSEGTPTSTGMGMLIVTFVPAADERSRRGLWQIWTNNPWEGNLFVSKAQKEDINSLALLCEAERFSFNVDWQLAQSCDLDGLFSTSGLELENYKFLTSKRRQENLVKWPKNAPGDKWAVYKVRSSDATQ